GDSDALASLARLRAVALDLLDDFHAIDDGSEDDVLAIQPGSLHGGDEELGSVGVGSSIGHRHDTGAGVLEVKVFVLKLVAIDGLATGAVVVGEVAALAHEVG